ncbi:MAG TPA: NUDIX hydrolase [Candidatus Eisenbacteria bacterium]|nr:NUDIX hydrolase [Candidatus Eisenbacteria bacterium]
MEIVRRIGEQSATYRFEDVRLERKGFLSIFSFLVGGDGRRDLMDRGNAVVILPVDFKRRELCMIEQPRHVKAFAATPEGRAALAAAAAGTPSGPFELPAASVTVLELPAGMIDPGETAAQAASRELAEETGIIVAPDALKKVAEYFPSLGGTAERMTAYFAELPDPVVTGPADGDGHERIIVWKMTFEEAWEHLASGRIETASSMILLRELKIRDLEARLAAQR